MEELRVVSGTRPGKHDDVQAGVWGIATKPEGFPYLAFHPVSVHGQR